MLHSLRDTNVDLRLMGVGTVFASTDAIGGFSHKLQCYVFFSFFISTMLSGSFYIFVLCLLSGGGLNGTNMFVYMVSLCLLYVWFELRL